MNIITCLNVAGCLLVALLGAHTAALLPWGSLPEPAVLLLLLLWGAAWALPFYIPAGVMALQLGGSQHAAQLTNVFDFIGFLAAVRASQLT